VRLTGRMKRPAPGATLEVVCDDGTIAVVPISVSRDSSITTRWASQRIKALDADVMAERDPAKVSELEKLITELSIRHSVLSKYTAWLAVDRSRTTDSVVVRTLVQSDFALGSEPSAGMSLESRHFGFGSASRSHRHVATASSRMLMSPQSDAMDLFDDSSDFSFSSPSGLTLPPHLTAVLLARAVRELLDEARISDEAFAELKAEALKSLALLSQSRETKKPAKTITKLLARAEKALAKGNEALARRHLSNIADQLEAMAA